MENFYVFIIRNDVIIYILCAFGLFWYVNELLRARRILRRAMFGLERETGTAVRNNALTFILLLSAIAGFVYYVNNRIAPTLPPEIWRPPTPTPDARATPLVSPTPLSTPTPPVIPLAPTVTLPGAPPVSPPGGGEATLTAVPPTPTPFVGCNIALNISEPANGAAVTGSISFFGTADTENFGHYTLEANGPQTEGQWASLLGRTINQRVVGSFLGSANLAGWASGPYLIRLTAVDSAGNETGVCVIQVTLDNS
jgi:hypothetical protein